MATKDNSCCNLEPLPLNFDSCSKPDFSTSRGNGWGEPAKCLPGVQELKYITVKQLLQEMEAGNVTFNGEKVHSLIHLSKLYYKHLNDQGE